MRKGKTINIEGRRTNKNHKNSNTFEEEKSSKGGEKVPHQRPPGTKPQPKNLDDPH